MTSGTVEGLERGGEIGARDAPQRLRPEHGGDGVAGGRDDHGLGVRGACRPAPAAASRAARAGRRRVVPARRGGPVREAGGELRIAREQGVPGVEHGDGPEVDGQRAQPRHSGVGGERHGRHRPPGRRPVARGRDNAGVTFTRIAWLVTVLACLITCVAMLLSGYQGYAALVFAVGACAAINLR